MIIRLLDDSTMPEDKVVMSVPDPGHLVKNYLPAIKQKLGLSKSMEKYTIWHVATNGRKADMSRDCVDKTKSWSANGVADKGFIYVLEKSDTEPQSAAASPVGSSPPGVARETADSSPNAITTTTSALPPPPPMPKRPAPAASLPVPPPPAVKPVAREEPPVAPPAPDPMGSANGLWSRFGGVNVAPTPADDDDRSDDTDRSPTTGASYEPVTFEPPLPPPPPPRPGGAPAGLRPSAAQFGTRPNAVALSTPSFTTAASPVPSAVRPPAEAAHSDLLGRFSAPDATPSLPSRQLNFGGGPLPSWSVAPDHPPAQTTAARSVAAEQEHAAALQALNAKLAELTVMLDAQRAAVHAKDAELAALRADLASEKQLHARAISDAGTLRDTLSMERREAASEASTLRLEAQKHADAARAAEDARSAAEHTVTALQRRVQELEEAAAEAKAAQTLKMDNTHLAALDPGTKQAATEHAALLDSALERRRRQVADTLSLYEYAHTNVETMRARALTEKDRMEQKGMLAAHRAALEATVHSALLSMTNAAGGGGGSHAAPPRHQQSFAGGATMPSPRQQQHAPELVSPSSAAAPGRGQHRDQPPLQQRFGGAAGHQASPIYAGQQAQQQSPSFAGLTTPGGLAVRRALSGAASSVRNPSDPPLWGSSGR